VRQIGGGKRRGIQERQNAEVSMRPFLRWLLPPLALVAGCTTTETTGPHNTGTTAQDAGFACAGPLTDAGFSSFSDLPVAALCDAQSFLPSYSPNLLEWGCGSWNLVTRETPYAGGGGGGSGGGSGSACEQFWLFDATTGALEALGGGCCGSVVCREAAPGFSFPTECLTLGPTGCGEGAGPPNEAPGPGGSGTMTNLCFVDAGRPGDAAGSLTDSAAEASGD
jgi:hypothetical protein